MVVTVQQSGAPADSWSAGTAGGPAAAAARDQVLLDRRLQAFGFALHTATQIASLLAWSALPASERAQRVASVVVQLAFLLLPWLVPAFYLRWRRPILVIERLQFFMWPLLRQARGIQGSLNNKPRPGMRGALQDLLRCIWGARLVAVALSPLVQPLNMLGLLPQAALQLYALAMAVFGHRRGPERCHGTSVPTMRKPAMGSEGPGVDIAASMTASSGGGSGGGSGSETARHAPVLHVAWEHELRIDRRLQLFGFALHTATQIASLLAWSTLPASERTQRVGSVAVQLAFLLLPWLVPAFYLRWRRSILIIERLQFFMWPLLRQPKGIQGSLNNEPQPGVRGALQDLLRCIWGARLVAVSLSPLVQPLNVLGLGANLALQLYSLAMVRSNRSLCAAPLVMHPLSRARIHTLHGAMRLATLGLPGGAGHGLASATSLSPQQECAAFFTFIGLTVGVLLPLWLLVKTETSSSLARWEASRLAAAATNSNQKVPLPSRIAVSFEATLRALCGRSWLSSSAQQQMQQGWQLEPWQRALMWWQMLSLAWLCSIALASE
ncbi:hypothetical protein C2E21_5920 [Chlorella sorokiniana]|uniref:Uncharacterized protein n=1 Tax=Chlorella sorokiniana TaxID=3076 RepID=A0A2P6TLZ4_CHLSO|nr:hypothetical protein C2E21_5920 [Chlorella sorokiniana]|eukprot:PRW45349.1 hypothetical protein C2E21_5920 [Chlorella sorokiniana]